MSQSLRVLQIEDSENDAELIVRLLEKAGYTVHSVRVEDAEGMEAALNSDSWDVIIADYHLPQFDAPSALKLLHEADKDIPFLVVSGQMGEDRAVAMMRAGAQDYLLKDNLVRLIPAVEREIRDARVRQERRLGEEALHERDEWLAMAVEATQLGAFDFYPQSDEAIWSAIAKQQMGLPDGVEITRETFLSSIDPADRERVETTLKRALLPQSNGRYAVEYRIKTAGDGGERWLSEWGRVTFDAHFQAVRMIGLRLDISERKQAELQLRELNDDLRSALEQKTVLIREVQHRVKNNLQVISSMLGLEADRFGECQIEVRRALQESRDRVRSMALIHEKFCHSDDLAEIEFSDFTDSLASYLLNSYAADSNAIRLTTNVTVKLAMDAAIPCGLIIQELMSNSMKHAFPDGAGEIIIDFHESGGRLRLSYRDSGMGLPAGIDIRNPQSLGLQLVADLVAQLNGTLEYRLSEGAEFVVKFRARRHS